MIFVKPKEGLKIRRPDTGSMLPEEGELVPDTPFWQRRVLDEDVTMIEKKESVVQTLAKKITGGDK